MSTPSPTLRVLLIDDGARHIPLIRDELTRLGYVVVFTKPDSPDP